MSYLIQYDKLENRLCIHQHLDIQGFSLFLLQKSSLNDNQEEHNQLIDYNAYNQKHALHYCPLDYFLFSYSFYILS
ncbi:MAG: hypothetical protein CMP59_10215 [Flavobacteriales bacterium]|nr:hypothetical protein [Flavobacteriales bacterium]